MEKEQAAQEESKKEEASNSSESLKEVGAFLDEVLKAAREDYKLEAIDKHNIQLSQIRQCIYMSATIGFAIAGLIVLTPYWGGASAPLAVGPVIFTILCAALLACIGSFIFGVFCLRGENTTVPIVDASFIDRADTAWGDDGSFCVHEAKVNWIVRYDEVIKEARDTVDRKGKKIRTLNLAILCAAVMAAVGAAAAFSTSLLENYVRQRTETATAEKTVNDQGSIHDQDAERKEISRFGR